MNPIDDYKSELKLFGRTIGYLKSVNYSLKKFQESINGKDLLKVDEDNIKYFIQVMRDQEFAERTIIENIRAIERFYSYIIESKKYGLLDNPVSRIAKRLNHKTIQTRRPIKTIEEISKFIKAIHNPRDRAIVVLLSKTAIRNGELTALNIEDIDFDNEILTIDKHINNGSTNSMIKGRKNGNETKIPLDDETTRALKFYLISRPKTNNALFISHNGIRLYEHDISRIVKDWSIKTKFGIDTDETDKKIVPHFFRAWSTYTLQINGLNPSIIDYIRGDVANSIRGFYFNQVLPFEVIKKEYLRTVPKFGI